MNNRLSEFFIYHIATLEKSREAKLEDIKQWKTRIIEQEEHIRKINREIGELMEARDTLIEGER